LKGLALSSLRRCVAAAALLACLSVHAQTTNYSVRLSAGYNAIANNLYKGQNTLNEVLPQVPDGTRLYKWNTATQSYEDPAEYIAGFGWSPQTALLRPGDGAFLFVNDSFSISFSGTVGSYSLPRAASANFNLIGGQRPGTLGFSELFGFAPIPGDRVYKYDRALTGTIDDVLKSASSVYTYSDAGWDIQPKLETGKAAFVYLSPAPRIIKAPSSQMALAGETVHFSVSALGAEPLSYEWEFREEEIAGATRPDLTLSNVQINQSGFYTVTVSNRFGSATSKPVGLRVLSPPIILKQPQSIRTIPNQAVSFRAEVTGTLPLRFQWAHNHQDIPTGTNATFEITSVKDVDVGEYFLKIRNAYGATQSVTVSLIVNIPPYIKTQPASQFTTIGGQVSFLVEAAGTQPLFYQWRLNSRNIPGETNATLRISSVKTNQAGAYDVLVANIAGTTNSDKAFLRFELPRLPFADKFEAATFVFSDPSFCGVGDNFDAGLDSGEKPHAGRYGGSSVWIRWRPREPGIVTFSTAGSSFDTVLAAYIGDSVAALSEVASDDDQGDFFTSRIRFAANPEFIYNIVVDGVDGAKGNIVLCWNFEPTSETLPIIVEQPRDQTASFGDTVSFSVRAVGTDLHYQWFVNGFPRTDVSTPTLTLFNVTNRDAASYSVRVYQGNRYVDSRIATLQFAFRGVENEPIHVFAFDKFADAIVRPLGNPNGFVAMETAFEGDLQAETAAPPTPVLGYTGTQIFSTYGGATEEGEMSHCGILGGASECFAFLAPANGTLYLNTDGSNFDTVLAVYTGSPPPLSGLTPIACDNNSGGNGLTSSLSMNAAASIIYYIAVDGVNGVTGTAYLNYRLLIPMTLTRVSKPNANTMRFRVNSTPSYPVTVQRTGTFLNWLNLLTTNSTTNGIFVFQDTNATPLKRFYRAVQTP